MQFWIRHFLLLLLCVVLPFAAALYLDTMREVDRATAAGLARARMVGKNLKTRLQLHAHEQQIEVLSLAAEIEDRDLHRGLNRSGARGEANFIQLRELLDEAAGRAGFAWYAGRDGQVLVENGFDSLPDAPRLISGHPVFVESQHGFALDGAWSEAGDLTWVHAAPVARDGVAAGAVIVGTRIGAGAARALATEVSGDVTLVHREVVQATTLPRPTAGEVRLATEETPEPVAAGRLDEPLASRSLLPFLPVMLDPHADGVAFASVVVRIPGAVEARWVVSVDATDGLDQVGARQEVLLGAMFASLLLAILVGLMNSRTFVRPIDTLEAHLSQIQLGRGDLELPERRVSGPFRRLVRLVNMTVQKMPARTLPSRGPGDSPVPSFSPARGKSPLSTPGPGELPGPRDPTPLVTTPPPAELEIRSGTPALLPLPSPVPVEPLVSEPSPSPSESVMPVAVDRSPRSDLESGEVAPPAPHDRGESDAIAEAIASLEQHLSGTPASIPPRADESQNDVPEPQTFEEVEGATDSEGPADGLRTGGSLELGSAGLPEEADQPEESDELKAEPTVVAPVQEDLLAKTARDDLTDAQMAQDGVETAALPSVPADFFSRSAPGDSIIPGNEGNREIGLDAADQAHFKDVYERFIAMRRQCGETTQDLGFERFLAKLTRNRESLVKKYACRTVRFQVYEKDGRAALKATPVRAR